MNIAMQLDITDVPGSQFTFSFDRGFCFFTRTPEKPRLFLQAIDILRVRTQESLLGIKGPNKVVCRCWKSRIYGTLEPRNEGVENCR